MGAERELDIETYARIVAELARDGAELELVLERHGLNEESWSAAVARFEPVLDVADDDAESPELERFNAAFARAQSELSGGPAGFETWLEVLAALARGEPLLRAIERCGLTLDRYLATQAHWAQRVAREPELLARFQAVTLKK
jgi:hypothetical protein